jgi:hypothetical protein
MGIDRFTADRSHGQSQLDIRKNEGNAWKLTCALHLPNALVWS